MPRHQKRPEEESTRVVIIGAGAVGTAAAFSIMAQSIASEIVLIDVNTSRAQGEASDLEHGLPFLPNCRVWAGDYRDCRTADVVVITAGLAQKPGQTRLDLAKANTKIVSDIVKKVTRQTKKAVILIVTNPLDVMTEVAIRTAKLPWGQVFGSGTTLDSARFAQLVSESFALAPENVSAFILGEHGDSEVPIYSHLTVMGESIKHIRGYSKVKVEKLFAQVRDAAYTIIKQKGATSWGIGAGIGRLVRAIIYDEHYLTPASVRLTGQYDLDDIALSVPVVIGRRGVEKVVTLDLPTHELKQLHRSAAIIRRNLRSIARG